MNMTGPIRFGHAESVSTYWGCLPCLGRGVSGTCRYRCIASRRYIEMQRVRSGAFYFFGYSHATCLPDTCSLLKLYHTLIL